MIELDSNASLGNLNLYLRDSSDNPVSKKVSSGTHKNLTFWSEWGSKIQIGITGINPTFTLTLSYLDNHYDENNDRVSILH